MAALPVNDGVGVGLAGGILRLLVLAMLGLGSAVAHDDEPMPTGAGMRLQFLPPPMEGTLSMGVFDAGQRLVRTLKCEAEIDDPAQFIKAFNGLITFWDETDDAGTPVPPGSYTIRGFTVGDLQIRGVATLGNDWAGDERVPGLQRVEAITVNTRGELGITYRRAKASASEADATNFCWVEAAPSHHPAPQPAPSASPSPAIAVQIIDGKLIVAGSGVVQEIALAAGETVVDGAPGFGDVVWAIVRAGSSSEVRAYAANGTFLRRLAYAPADVQPVSIKPSPADARIHLLEQNPSGQRVRTLEPAPAPPSTPPPADPGNPPVSFWRETFSRTIWFSDTFEQVRHRLRFPDGSPFVPAESVRVRLRYNEMEQGRPDTVDLTAGFDAAGSFLKTADGLLLRRISDRPGLRWVVCGRAAGTKTLVVFQGDGVVIEEFHIGRPANMMAFDLGTFEAEKWRARTPIPAPSPSAVPGVPGAPGGGSAEALQKACGACRNPSFFGQPTPHPGCS